MSAFLCSNYHITVLATYAQRTNSFHNGESIEAIGHILHTANLQSVNYRYQEHSTTTFTVDRRALVCRVFAIQIIKAARCLNYQSCEHPDYENSQACRILRDIIADAMCELPGYDEAQWELRAT